MTDRRNSRKPSDLQHQIDALGKQVSASLSDLTKSLVEVCRIFSEGWNAYDGGEWDNEEFRTFAISIHAAGIGPDPKNSLLIVRDNNHGKYEIQSTWKYMAAIAKSDMFLDDDILAVCRVGSITNLYEISSLWLECQRKKNTKTSDPVLGKKRMLRFLEKNQDPTRDQIVGYKNELKAENANDPRIPRATMEGSILGVVTIEQLVASGATFDTILVTPNEEHWAEIEKSSVYELDEKYGFATVRNEKSCINISANGKRAAMAIKLASVMGVSNPEILVLTDQPIVSRAIPLDQATIIVSNQKLKAPSRIGKKDTSALTREMTKSEGSNLHLFADEPEDGWTIAKS